MNDDTLYRSQVPIQTEAESGLDNYWFWNNVRRTIDGAVMLHVPLIITVSSTGEMVITRGDLMGEEDGR